jgi:NAD(P)-dependent dehydrogenase (short-subunit alcohol dehydrogenase family)
MNQFRCLVFGGSGALGRVICRELSSRGARVALTYHSNEDAAVTLAGSLPGARALPLDATSVADVERCVDAAAEALGGIDAFVHCAGVATLMECAGEASSHRMAQVDEAAFDRTLSVNAKSAFFAVRRLTPILRAAGGGNIVLMGSVDGVKPVPSPVHYAASKGALKAMTQAMSKELGEYKIRVNMVAPGVLEGGISRDIPENLLREYVKHCGLKRVGRFEEVAALVGWLALENTYVTGQAIVLDGAL